MRKSLLALFFILSAVPLLAATLAGVTLPDTVTVGDKTLVLNGMGLRKKLFISVYVGGLYLDKKSADPNAIIQADQPKRTVLHFVYSEVSRDQMADAFKEGFDGNTPDKVKTLKPQIDQWIAALEAMKKGEEMAVTYVPGTGTTLTLRGKDKLTIPGLPFAQAVFAVWLGPKPPSNDLKTGMLGRK